MAGVRLLIAHNIFKRKRRIRSANVLPGWLSKGRLPVHVLSVIAEERRNCGIQKSNEGYWERALEAWEPRDFKKHLRLEKSTFEKLAQKIHEYLDKKKTNFKEPISTQCRLAITLWRLGGAESYRGIAEHFGLGKTTVFTITIEICGIITRHIFPAVVHLPRDLRLAAHIFCMDKGLPNCIGAIDGSHIAIPRPVEGGPDYWNRKCFHSINIQALVDSKGRFIDAVIGWPGKVHDARMLSNSVLFQRAQAGDLFPVSDLIIDGVQIPYYIIGDSAYPLASWLVKPYHNCQTPEEEHFNKKISGARQVVERAFGRLKQRWRCLLHCCDASPKNASLMIAACLALHNICEDDGDLVTEEIVAENENETVYDNSVLGQGARIRDALKNFVARS